MLTGDSEAYVQLSEERFTCQEVYLNSVRIIRNL